MATLFQGNHASGCEDLMSEREALVHFGVSEPDGNDPAWQPWHDDHLQALALSRSLAPRGELEPTFTVETNLDGDDWPPTATEVVRARLDETVAALKSDGVIIEGEVRL